MVRLCMLVVYNKLLIESVQPTHSKCHNQYIIFSFYLGPCDTQTKLAHKTTNIDATDVRFAGWYRIVEYRIVEWSNLYNSTRTEILLLICVTKKKSRARFFYSM